MSDRHASRIVWIVRRAWFRALIVCSCESRRRGESLFVGIDLVDEAAGNIRPPGQQSSVLALDGLSRCLGLIEQLAEL